MSQAKAIKLAGAREAKNRKRQKEEAEADRWEKAEESWKITPREIRHRVKMLREELEAYRKQLEGVPFDLPCGDLEPPRSLNSSVRRQYTLTLIEGLYPGVAGLFKMIDDYCIEHGTHDFLDFQAKLFALENGVADLGFKIGVLAGAIFSNASKEAIDSLERGFAFDLIVDGRWSRKEKRHAAG